MSTINNTIDFDTAYLVASEFGITARKKKASKKKKTYYLMRQKTKQMNCNQDHQ